MKKTILLIGILPLNTLALAAGDTLGVYGAQTVGYLNGLGVPPEIASKIYVGVLGAVCVLIQEIFRRFVEKRLKNMKTTWYWNTTTRKWAASWFQRLLARYVGNPSVLRYNATFDASKIGAAAANTARIEEFKQHMLKHDPVLSIEVK